MEGSLPGALLALAYFGVFQLCGLCLALSLIHISEPTRH